jgi:membrane-associated phospholipid phosphatase
MEIQHMMRFCARGAFSLFLLVLPYAAGGAQSAPDHGSENDAPRWEASTALLATSFVFDERLRSVALAHRTRTLDQIAGGADIIGTAGHIVPGLVATYVVSRYLGDRSFASATLRVGMSYAAADAIEALLKPAIGRRRPYAGREPLTFRPFSSSDDFHSFPSAHVVHIASLTSAIAIEADRPWVTALAAVAMTYVGMQRVYRDEHWSSDVVASGMLGVSVARATMSWLHRRDGSR